MLTGEVIGSPNTHSQPACLESSYKTNTSKFIEQGQIPTNKSVRLDLPRWRMGKESACQSRRCQSFSPLVGKIPWMRSWQPTPVFWPGKSHWQRSLAGYIVHGVAKSQTRLSTHTYKGFLLFLVVIVLTKWSIGKQKWSISLQQSALNI